MDTSQHIGRCHCGNLSLRFVTTLVASELPVRVCACTFCRGHRLRWTTDPSGRVEIEVADASELGRYRFGTETADFLSCRRCSTVLAAISHDDAPRAVINADVLACADALGDAVVKDFDGEGLEDRLARRAQVWTPASLHLAG